MLNISKPLSRFLNNHLLPNSLAIKPGVLQSSCPNSEYVKFNKEVLVSLRAAKDVILQSIPALNGITSQYPYSLFLSICNLTEFKNKSSILSMASFRLM